jgi:hypothetical protein
VSGGAAAPIAADANAASALQICASGCATTDGCQGFYTVTATSNSPIFDCCLVGTDLSGIDIFCRPDQDRVTISYYAIAPGQVKAASTPISCTKSVDGVSTNITCTAKPLQ